MSRWRFVVMLAACAMLTACLTLPPSMCTYNDNRPWRRLQEPPANADHYLALAEANPNMRGHWQHKYEYWLALPTGEIML
jgi:hypothetical protein